jgi:hypothetical protein
MTIALPPAFLVTIDTEGDNLWSRPHEIQTRNAAFLPRFQALCEAYGIRPTWLVNYEMAMSTEFQRFGRDVVQRDVGEIGMHLHAWNSPPIVPLTDDDFVHQPFLTEYPHDVLEEKVTFLTDLLRDRFETPIVSHRAGRWGFDEHYARTLARLGYRVDCSVCPHVSWRGAIGAPSGQGGPDFRGFPTRPYLVDLDHIGRAGSSDLLELPMSVARSPLQRIAPWAYRTPGLRRWAWRGLPPRVWLYPDGRNLAHLHYLFEEALATHQPYLQMVIHSSELMPGGGPNAPDGEHVEHLYRDLHALFALVEKSFAGMTLSQYREAWMAARQRPPAATSPSGRAPAPAASTAPSASAHVVTGDLA